jgi:hypothetical protein
MGSRATLDVPPPYSVEQLIGALHRRLMEGALLSDYRVILRPIIDDGTRQSNNFGPCSCGLAFEPTWLGGRSTLAAMYWPWEDLQVLRP